jgi:Transglycosylase SLT domain/Putative peptidoglycan binding domain/LysM domain
MRRGAVLSGLLCLLAPAAAAPAAPNPQLAGLQVALRSRGLYHGRIDAVAGPATRDAVVRFQRQAGLVPDGVAGPRTRAALGPLGRPLFGTRMLHRGMVGWDVSVLQFLLVRRGFSPGRLDGRLGAPTESALVRFQRAVHLTPDGILGPRTARALRGLPIRPRGPRRFALYLVRAGDTLTAIAEHYRLPIATLAQANHLDPGAILPVGARLRVPLASLSQGADADDTGGLGRVRALIDYWAAREGVDPRLARALAWMESGYNQSVVSPAGAVGVMQVTPSAWAYVESVLIGSPVRHDLAGNVRVGVALLHELLHEFAPDRGRALAAYLQGSYSVRTEGILPATRIYVADIEALATRL